MKNAKVVQLGMVRDLLTEWNRVRDGILAGKVTGFHTTLRDDAARETIYLGGVYQDDPTEALKATLRASMARALADDPPLKVAQG